MTSRRRTRTPGPETNPPTTAATPSLADCIRRDRVILLVLFLAALALRLLYLQASTALPTFDTLMLDAQIHEEWADEIAHGGFLGNPAPYFRAPLYPYFLSLFKSDLNVALWGGNEHHAFYYGARIAQMVLGALNCVLIYLLARLMRDRRAGIIAGAMAALYWVFIFFEGELLLPVLIVFLDLAAFLALREALRTGRRPAFLLAGILFGLSAVTRPNILLFIPVLLVWLYRSGMPHRAALQRGALIAAGIAACVLPVTARNVVYGRDLVLISSQAGVNFYVGNNPHSDGFTAVVPGTDTTWMGGYLQTAAIASREAGRQLKPSEISDFWFRKGLAYLADQPGDALRLYGTKLRLLLDVTEISNNMDIYYCRNAVGFLSLPFFLSTGVVLPLGLVGMVACRRDRWARLMMLFVAAYLLSFLLFFVTTRFRVPAMPFLMILAGVGLSGAWAHWREGARGQVAAPALLFLALFVVFQAARSPLPPGADPQQPSQGRYTMGLAWYRKGDFDRAVPIFESSRAVPYVRVQALMLLGEIYALQHRDRAAVSRLREALQLQPELQGELRAVLERIGRRDLQESIHA